MNILITNDDGWGAKGILTLTKFMQQLGHVTVIAPDGARSGQSNAISVNIPLSLKQVSAPTELEGADIYITNGTPSDCVKLAVNTIFKGQLPDLVVSGINHGSNAAINVIYSGTMGACFVAAEQGIPAIGFSLNDHNPDADFSKFEQYILPLTRQLLSLPHRYGTCYNINAPVGEIIGVRFTRQCKGHWTEEFFPKTDDEGNTTYTLTGYFVNHEPEAEDTDEWALAHGYITITPDTINLTDYEHLKSLHCLPLIRNF